MFDASSLLGGMLSGGFGRRRSSGSGVLGTVATVGGIAAVGGLGYMAYKHFTAQPGAHAGPPGWGGAATGAPGFGPPGMGGAPGAAPGWGGGQVPGAPPGVGGWGAPPGTPGAPGQPGGVGGFVQGLMGSSTGLQKGGFGGPGYEYQTGGAMAAAAPAPQYPPFAPAPGMGAPGMGAPGMGAPGMGAPGMGAPGAGAPQGPPGAFPGGPPPASFGASPVAPTTPGAPVGAADAGGAVPIPPPPVFDPTTGQVTSSPAASAPAAPGAPAGAPVQAPGAGPAAAPPVDPMPNPDAATQASAMLLVRAMVAAANADGVIDDAERKDILERLASTGVGPEEQAALAQELDRPRPVAALVAEVTSPDLARQFYAVSLLAIEVDNAAEKLHMKALPAMLGLSAEDVAKIHADLGVPAL